MSAIMILSNTDKFVVEWVAHHDDVSVRYLQEYLDHYLALPDCFYDQHWALSALMWIDAKQDTTYARPYLVPGGLWEGFVVGKTWRLKDTQKEFQRLMAFCQQHFSR